VFDDVFEGTADPGGVYFNIRGRSEPILDCTSQAWVLNLGHAPPDVIYGLALQSQKTTHVRYGFLTAPRVRLCNKLADIAPGQLKGGRVALNNLGGGGAIECAIKTAFVNSKRADQIAIFWQGYHGSSLALSGATQQIGMAMRYRPFGIDRWVKMPFPYCYRCPWNYSEGFDGKKDKSCNLECLDLVKNNLDYYHTSGIAGVLLETMQGAGGQIPAPGEFLLGLKGFCKENKMTLIFDECQTGFGRCGKMWATEYYSEQLGQDCSPDIIASTKGCGAGYPLGVTIAKPRIKILSEAEEHTTFSSSPALMAASLVTIEILTKKKIPENAAKQGDKITAFIREMMKTYPEIGDIRGPGLFIGVEMVKDPKTREPFNKLVEKIIEIGWKNNVFFGTSMPILKKTGEMRRNVLKIKPPLIISDEETEKVCQLFEKCFKEALAELKA
jgi:4-aminobutyrate aminotransferase-like enzyme